MDLRKFYLENVSEQEYYYNFYELIRGINETYNVFYGTQETQNYEFIVDDIEDAIEKFKYLCQPENECHNSENKCWFYLVSFYLYKCGYVIKDFPRILEHPPTDTYDFVNKQIRNKIIANDGTDNGIVRYAERRKLIANFSFVQKDIHIEVPDAIEQKFKEISNRHASFQGMSTDEKLAEIANLIENMLKKDGSFLSIDYSQLCFDYIDENMIKKYRKQLQCFRHSSVQSIEERKTFSKEQKLFLIDFGLTVVKTIHMLINQ